MKELRQASFQEMHPPLCERKRAIGPRCPSLPQRHRDVVLGQGYSSADAKPHYQSYVGTHQLMHLLSSSICSRKQAYKAARTSLAARDRGPTVPGLLQIGMKSRPIGLHIAAPSQGKVCGTPRELRMPCYDTQPWEWRGASLKAVLASCSFFLSALELKILV